MMGVEGRKSKVEGVRTTPSICDGMRSQRVRPSTLNTQHSTSPRSGLTLYEVLLALSIMLISLSVLGGHITFGTRAAITANVRTEAALLCETKMNEVVAGVEPLTSTGGPLVSAVPGEWTWSSSAEVGIPHVDTVAIEVVVERVGFRGWDNVRFSLRRIIRDPALFSDAADAAAAEEDVE